MKLIDRKVFSDLSLKNQSLFAIYPILGNIFACAVIVGLDIYVEQNMLFPAWTTYIWWGARMLIVYNILAASARSLLAPILSLLTAFGGFYWLKFYENNYFGLTDVKSLIVISALGFIVTFILRL